MVAAFKINSAPWVLRSFSEIVRFLSVLFYLSAVPMISPPVIPISLSYNLIFSMYLFCKITAAMHFAPSTPKEFLRMLPSCTPKSRVNKPELLLKSSTIISNPASLIILDDKFKCFMRLFAIIDFTECIPLSDIALSAKLRVSYSRYLASYNKLLKVIIQFTPSLMEYKFRTFFCFFKFIRLNSSLKTFAFSEEMCYSFIYK